jgi:Fe-S cluster assembly protein SufD
VQVRLSSAVTVSAPARESELYDRLASFGDLPFRFEERVCALDRFFGSPSGREKPSRFWRVDFESVAPAPDAVAVGAGKVTIESSDPKIVACDLATAAREHPDLLARALRTTAATKNKFGALTEAFAGLGAFVFVPADRACDDPIAIRYQTGSAAIFPWSVVLAERGARLCVTEHITTKGPAFVCGIAEIVADEHADVTYAVVQRAGDGARTIANRVARPGRDARAAWALAELGGDLAAVDVSVSIEQPGAETHVTALFFPSGTQHIDLVSTVDHRAGEATSETLVKSAARERGQARFLGNIRIAPHAQGSDARLRDDALLLSTTAHVDSVPALEIGANDVKAYHGATVGAIDAEQTFYMESRGIDRAAAERMIALGFFEPAIEHFPSATLRDEIRAALAEKLI